MHRVTAGFTGEDGVADLFKSITKHAFPRTTSCKSWIIGPRAWPIRIPVNLERFTQVISEPGLRKVLPHILMFA